MLYVIPKFFYNNEMILDIDGLSYTKWIQYKKAIKNEVKIEQNILIFVIKGEKVIHADKDFYIKSNSALFLKKGNYVMSEILSLKEGLYEALIFFYEEKLLKEIILKYPKIKEELSTYKNSSNIFQVDITSYMKISIDSMISIFTQKDIDKNILKLKFEEFFLNLINSNAKEEFLGFLNEILQSNNLKNYIESNIDEFKSIKEIAIKLKISQSQFRKEFKEAFGISPKIWFDKKKLERAKVLLTTTNLNVTEVCFEVGFDNISWFIQRFKKEFGITPKQLQKIKN